MNIHNVFILCICNINGSNQIQIYLYNAKKVYFIINFTGAKHGIYISEFNISLLLQDHVMLDDFKFPEYLQHFC